MRASLLLLGGIVVFSVAVARALSCVCSPFECDILTDDDCPGGLTWDPCRCCKVCARVEGEPCGGLFGFSGSCADGLQCVIKNLLPNAREVDEGICTKIPGRWRRHCPQGPIMSEPGCNLVSEGTTGKNGNTVSTGKCVCGPSVHWCPSDNEPPPYDFATHHECKLNLAAKMDYDDLFNSGNMANDDVEGDSRPVEDRCPENSVLTEDGKCECAPCPPASCRPGYRPEQVRAAPDPETPGSCCPLYECRPAESVLLLKETAEVAKSGKYCIYGGKGRKLGEQWQQSDCVNCVCGDDGEVSCHEPMCKPCDNAIPPGPGQCCPRCPLLSNATVPLEPAAGQPAFDDCELICRHGYDKDQDRFPICGCANPLEKGDAGDDDDEEEEEEEEEEDNDDEEEDDESCPEPGNCEQPDCKLGKDGNGCAVCVCPTSDPSEQAANETAGKKICPEVKCELHCERGLVMDENDCTFCECKPSDSSCPPLIGCGKRCEVGYRTSKRGCPICRCRGSCTDRWNGTYPEGASWRPNSCTSCTCEPGGKLSCRETVCSVGCADPLPPSPGTCCPICPIAPGSGKENGTSGQQHVGRGKGWGTVPIILIAILVALCLALIVHIVRGRFRARLSPSEPSYYSYPSQYYKCVPAYDTPVHVHRNEKIVPL